ncbi:hypothetical protein DPM19_17290 [Actinomadura craniellae]|uniref:Sulfotransferase family protein n=2 Tax=Actinomadura craniellae TaxID=2231787 RepID=A0A365H4K0_9ACTN|nr:hypothetical protein DPM19_17290 [Actinomadura craniellae]
MISERGDFTVFAEPFSAYYYYSDERASYRYLPAGSPPEAQWSSILSKITDAADTSAVFVRDMAYHVAPRTAEVARLPFVHTFIIRHPLRALLSLHRLLPDFTADETGFEAQYRLAREVQAVTGNPPLIINGDELRDAPENIVHSYCDRVGIPYLPDALSWERGMRKEWGPWARWHHDVAASTGFRPRDAIDHSATTLPARVDAVYEKCLDAYLGMVALKEAADNAI